jgi:hypothetical protein
MPHLVLLGDSVFDNAFYVPGEPAVIDQIRPRLPSSWQATLLAIDGNVVEDVARQLQRLPDDATHLAISAGGNNALGFSSVLSQPVKSVAAALAELADIQTAFQDHYREMLAEIQQRRLPAVLCTIYDAIPGLSRDAQAALAVFNDVITREAAAARIPVFDLRLLCTEPVDFSPLSPIEPSAIGGQKISSSLARFVTSHDFTRSECVVFA